MNIWIGLANTPYVLFFKPIIELLANEGHSIHITLRRFNQTVQLSQRYGIDRTETGRHGGRSNLSKLFNLFHRTGQLVYSATKLAIDLEVSHNSYTHALAGRVVVARVVTLMDYEGQPANHIAF